MPSNVMDVSCHKNVIEIIGQSEADRILRMKSVDLRRGIEKCMGIAAKNIVMAAVMFSELERRGENTSDLRLSYPYLYRRIAAGQVLGSLIQLAFKDPQLLSRMSKLPLTEQKKIAERGVDVVVIDNGKMTVERKAPTDLRPGQVCQVFAKDHERTHEEQAAFIQARQAEESTKIDAIKGLSWRHYRKWSASGKSALEVFIAGLKALGII